MSKLLIQEPPLQVLPTLAKTIGLNGAIVIQQLHYWLENPKIGRVVDGEKWVDNSYAEWQENFPFWSVATIKRIFADLEESGFVISGQFDKSDWSQRKSYRIVYETLDSINLTQSSVSNRAALNKELTETTTDIAADAASLDVQAITESANQAVDQYLEMLRAYKAPTGTDWKNREVFLQDHLAFADWYHGSTGQTPSKKDVKSWMKAFSEWEQERLTVADLQVAYETDIVWRKVFTDPNELTKKAKALKAQRIARKTDEERPEYKPFVPQEEQGYIPNPYQRKK